MSFEAMLRVFTYLLFLGMLSPLNRLSLSIDIFVEVKRFSYHKITPSFLRCLFCVLVELPFVRQYSLHLSEDFWVLNKLVLSEE